MFGVQDKREILTSAGVLGDDSMEIAVGSDGDGDDDDDYSDDEE